MKPLELSSISEIWKSALQILGQRLVTEGTEPQLWFQWGKVWRGHDSNGVLPPTELPIHLLEAKGAKFAGRQWCSIVTDAMTWLICIKVDNHGHNSEIKNWNPPEAIFPTLKLLGEFVRMECLLGLTLRILENRAGEHMGHWDRVRNLALAIGRKLGIAGKEFVELELTALLHDIGKVALPGSILEVSRPLSPAERRQIESHSVIGAGMVREIPGMEKVAEGVLSHHESPDGTGYPKGLTLEDIPLTSLIVGAADAFDAMTHFRPYAAERTYHETLDEMANQRGRYDDRVLWALKEVLKALGIMEIKPISPSTLMEPNVT
ncbi:MAG: HD domain-containing protein [Candidatus Riflebacteria bacterium]|nr:HD domain-containing protein [Candidatus Riflebacteria bacterium]